MQRYLWVLVAFAGVSVVYRFAVQGQFVLAVTFGVLNLLLVWWVSPWRGGKSLTRAEVMALPAAERRVVIYWRPGCQFCARLKSGLGESGKQARWVNIWQDKDAAEFVRSANDGNETVPTVVMDGRTLTNPEPEIVLSRLTA